MRKLVLIKSITALMLTALIFVSCSKDDDNPQPTGFEVSGSSFNGIYKLDVDYTKGTKYVNEVDDSEYLKTFTDDDIEMWGLHKRMQSVTYLYYKTEKDGQYPPETGWTCGLGVSKPNFCVKPIYD